MNKKILIFVTATVAVLGAVGFYNEKILGFVRGDSSVTPNPVNISTLVSKPSDKQPTKSKQKNRLPVEPEVLKRGVSI